MKLCSEKTVPGEIVTRILNKQYKTFHFLGELKIDNAEQMLRKCTEVAMRTSFYSYIHEKKYFLHP